VELGRHSTKRPPLGVALLSLLMWLLSLLMELLMRLLPHRLTS
jgi:hypothetical protein